jgi:Amt family ammonium transporter
VFTLLWATFVYDPVAHWVWGTGGWLASSARSTSRRHRRAHHERRLALVAALVLGRRKGSAMSRSSRTTRR